MNRIGKATLEGLFVISLAIGATPLAAADIDPAIAGYILPKDIPWKKNPLNPGNEQAVLYGDPNKPGDFYIARVKWLPGNMSRPHFHQNDRLIVVISGTWWVGTGDKFDPASTVPMPAGTYVTHYGGKIHYDGAKDEETVIEVHGIGPAASKPAERK
jgi:hypothetical protein